MIKTLWICLFFSKCRKVKSRSGLKFTVKVLTLNGPYKSMFRGNTFESCVSVEISDCQSCLDLEIFHRTRSLALNFCDKISSLAGLRKLKLEYVAIRHCRNITDFSPLCVVPHVCLSLHSNEYTQRLGISQALTFTSFQGLQDVKTLEIHNVMSNQLYLTPLLLGNNETLIISGAILNEPGNRERLDQYYSKQSLENHYHPVYVKRNQYLH
jgi:hypothetical protein